MRSFRQLSFAVCAAATLTSTATAAFELTLPAPGLRIVLFHEQSDFESTRSRNVEYPQLRRKE